MAALSVLAIAVVSRTASYVFLSRGELQDWGSTAKAAESTTDMAGFTQERINELKPDVVVSEKCGSNSRKGEKTRSLIRAISETASHNSVMDVSVPRPAPHPSKFEEAQTLAKRYPDIAGYLPAGPRRIYQSEPRSLGVFEALVLAEQVIYGPPDILAAAMG